MLIGKDLLDEKKYLTKTINTINELLDKYVDSSNAQDKEIIKHRKFLWDNRSELDEIEINENCSQVAMQEKMHSKKVSRIRTLEKQLSSPYFARIDFKEDKEDAESFYIGLSTVENEEDFEFIVFDWRSPVSNMFYDFETGPAFYDAPNRRINGEIIFNRQYNIRNGEIVFMHNSNESLCDDALVSMLGNTASDKMKNIVATIQKEQNDIIRSDESKILFIQGAAGSGKTSIALHRSAYLLYKHRKDLKADNILIFSPNEVFAEYISDVLPELGETNILQTTFEMYSNKFLPKNYLIESKNTHLDNLYSLATNSNEYIIKAKAMEFKNSSLFGEVLSQFIEDLPNYILKCESIIIDGKTIINKNSVSKTFINRFADVPFLNRIDLVKKSLFSQLETKYLNDKDNVNFDYVEDRSLFYDHCKEQVNLQVDNMIKTLNPIDIYTILFKNIEKYLKDTSVKINEIKELTLDYLAVKEVKFEDITPIMYIRASMEGFRNYSNIKHLLIDEAQDYSPLFYEIIKKSFPLANITIMGDLNQRIDKHSNVKNKDSITSLFQNIKSVQLTKSYRSTWNITMFTKDILKNGEKIEAVERRGENPTINIIKSNLPLEIKNKVDSLKNKGYESIAIICKTNIESLNTYNNLKDLIPSINLINEDNASFKAGVNVITSYISKGLEFDAVIISDGENYLNNFDENLFYTVCTRALHELHIYSNAELSKILPKNKELYTVIN
ncbi:HelD family protein [Clostridium sp.]|uniref:HelD family protein n=1 Tax=Clostridium sp. TaxID=1506 RepID=UPI003F307264